MFSYNKLQKKINVTISQKNHNFVQFTFLFGQRCHCTVCHLSFEGVTSHSWKIHSNWGQMMQRAMGNGGGSSSGKSCCICNEWQIPRWSTFPSTIVQLAYCNQQIPILLPMFFTATTTSTLKRPALKGKLRWRKDEEVKVSQTYCRRSASSCWCASTSHWPP